MSTLVKFGGGGKWEEWSDMELTVVLGEEFGADVLGNLGVVSEAGNGDRGCHVVLFRVG